MSIFHSKTQDGTLNVLVCGTVVRDAELKQSKNGTDFIRFTVAYGKKLYMDCETWADSDVGALAACLEKGDVIGAAGTYRKWEYNGKEYSSVSVDAIFSMASMVPVPPSAESTTSDDTSKLQEELDEDDEYPF